MKKFNGETFKKIRNQKCFTQEELSKKTEESSTFVNEKTISHWENCPTANPRIRNLESVAKALGISSIDEFFTDDQVKEKIQIKDREVPKDNKQIYLSDASLISEIVKFAIDPSYDDKKYVLEEIRKLMIFDTDEKEELVIDNKKMNNISESAIGCYLKRKLEYDIKKYYYHIQHDSMDRIMTYFSDSKMGDLEKKEITDDVDFLYDLLGWDNYKYFDSINSFWTIFSYGLHAIAPDDYPIAPAKNIKNAYKEEFNEEHGLYHYDSYPQKYNSSEKKLKVNNKKLRKESPQIDVFSELVHSVQNFMPVPDKDFNIAKGSSLAHDFLPLMIELIEQCLERNEGLVFYEKKEKRVISFEQLNTWKKFFKLNREKFALEQEYYYDLLKDRLIGKLLFEGQSFNNLLPEDLEEYKKCLNQVIKRMKIRGDVLARRSIEVEFK